jgi:hypothetical protein
MAAITVPNPNPAINCESEANLKSPPFSEARAVHYIRLIKVHTVWAIALSMGRLMVNHRMFQGMPRPDTMP